MERNFYCRNRDCAFHQGISKNENVICNAKKLKVGIYRETGLKSCWTYKKQ